MQVTLALLLGDSANPIVLEVVVVGNDPVCSLWQVPGRESQHRTLRFGSKVML